MEPTARTNEPERPSATRRTDRGLRLGLWEVMVLIAGLAFGLWLVLADFRGNNAEMGGDVSKIVLLGSAAVLGGLALVGVPLLLAEKVRRGRPWGPGKILWFASGTSAWLLWPPVVFRRMKGEQGFETASGMCFAYGTPLMAVYVTAALLAGGRLRRRRRGRRSRRPWREQFGLLLGMAWACTGLYVLYMLYRDDFSK